LLTLIEVLNAMKKFAMLFALPLFACATTPDRDVSLVGSKWSVVSIDGAPAVSDKASLEFYSDRISATVGCNGMGGDWRVSGNRIITGPFMSTKMFCDSLMEQERAMSELIEADPRFTISNDLLVLRGGGHVVDLRRRN
jgi:heat shock protein HslJ